MEEQNSSSCLELNARSQTKADRVFPKYISVYVYFKNYTQGCIKQLM
jgi:hypothetical protein